MTQTPIYEIEGQSFSLPCHVRDASSGGALYLVPADEARKLLGGPEIDVAEFLPGKTICSITAVDYKDNDLGDYLEVSIALFVRPAGERPFLPWLGNWTALSAGKLGVHILHLPVNQSFTCEAGRKIWGYPKTVQEIKMTHTEDRAVCELVYDGEHALTFSTPRGGEKTRSESPVTTYSYIDGTLYKTVARQTISGFGTHKGASAKLILGSGVIADQLRALGLPKKPITAMWMGKMVACLLYTSPSPRDRG